MSPDIEEPQLVAAILSGHPPLSRNRNFELLSSETGRRARRRAAFLRSIARDIERLRAEHGAITIERGQFSRGEVRLVIHAEDFTRRAYLTGTEIGLIALVYPLAARVLDVSADA